MKNSSKKQLTINAVLNVTKQLASIVFPLITFPYITKTLGVEPYGQYNFTSSIISYIALIAGLGITNYAVREGSRLKQDKSALNVFVNEILSLNCIALFISYIVLLGVVLYFRDLPTYKTLLLIQSISVFFSVVGCEWLNVIYEDYTFITIRYITLQAIAVFMTFIFVKGPGDLIKYALISQIAGSFANVSNIVHFQHKWDIRFRLVFKHTIFSHLKSVLILFGNAVSMLIYVNSDITIIGAFCGDIDVGIYSVAVKIYTIVKQLLNAMMLVAVPRMSRWTGVKGKDELNGQLNEILRGLLIFLIPAIVGLFCLSKEFIIFLSGPEYVMAENALKVLAVTLCFSTGVCFYSNLVLIPNNMEKYIFRATIISAIMNIVLNLISIPIYGFVAAAYTTLISEAFSVFYMIIAAKGKYFPSILKSFIGSMISGLIIIVCCIFVRKQKINNIETIFFSIILSVFCWGAYWLTIFLFNKKAKHSR